MRRLIDGTLIAAFNVAWLLWVAAIGLYWLVCHSWRNALEYQRKETEG